jgi:UDP-N-acetylglucosamine--N-acetylmuramyl-(pentapeptide) pyrophosphoryl-undecaprenol N-acetylglucosamine transferase
MEPDAEIHFVGATGGMEETIVPKHGYPIHLLRVGRLHRSVGWWRRLVSTLLLPLSFFQALGLYLKLRPAWVLGVGGFASGPFVFAASLLGGRTAILEPNAYPGLANRWLAKVVGRCFVVFSETKKFFPSRKVTLTGLPVRIQKKPSQLNYDGRRPFRVLVFGGSQGARGINRVVGDWVEGLKEEAKGYQIIHQTGALDYSKWQQRYGDLHKDYLTYQAYIDDMPTQMDWADLIICRAGINSVVEVAMSSRPAIFVPLPTAADNHQFKNAQALVDQGAARLIEEKDLSQESLGQLVKDLKNNPDQLLEMTSRLKTIDYSGAQQEIVQTMMEMSR